MSEPKPLIITTKQFIAVFKDIDENSRDQMFCFILGAGASVSAGIPSGTLLAKKWLDELKEFFPEPKELEKWINDEKIDADNPGSAYSRIYAKRFSFNKQSGYEELVKYIEAGRLTFGYAVLAQLISKERSNGGNKHNVVITTNFDSLTEDAVYFYTNSRPLVCFHESLTEFAIPSVRRPLIAKVHRDVLFHPMSEPGELKAFTDGWKRALNNILPPRIPIVLGYGGNDGTLMQLLKEISPLQNIFWCLYGDEKPSEEIVDVVKKHNGRFVKTKGFEDAMFALHIALDLPMLDKKISEFANNRVNQYLSDYDAIRKIQEAEAGADEKKLLEKQKQKIEVEWWKIRDEANGKTLTEGAALFEEALKKHNDSSELRNAYALFLDDRHPDYDKQINLLDEAINISIKQAGEENEQVATYYNNLGSAWKSKGEYDKAIEYYEKALAIDKKFHGEEHPAIATRYNNLGLAWDSKGEYDKAIEYYEKALAVGKKFHGEEHPAIATHYNNLGLAWDSKGEYDKAVEYYEKALAIDKKFHGEKHPAIAIRYNNLGSAWDSKGEYDKAIEYYEKALAIDKKFHGEEHPDIATRYNNLGSAWQSKGEYDKAIEYYEKALAIDKKFHGEEHPDIATCYNNLGFAWKSKGEYDRAIEYYEKAFAIGRKFHSEKHSFIETVLQNLQLAKSRRKNK